MIIQESPLHILLNLLIEHLIRRLEIDPEEDLTFAQLLGMFEIFHLGDI